jgi:hypothetical protein
MTPTAQRETLADVLARRDDPMVATRHHEWLKPYATIPADAAPPLAMSPPHPRAVGSYGPTAIEWARTEMGVTYRWWQALAICRQLEHDAAGDLVWREVVETGPRRIGKSVRLRGTALWRIDNAETFGEPQLAMLVSKDLAVGKEIHRPSWPWAERRGWNVLRLGGAQEVETPKGDRWLLRAPNAAYGYDVGYGQVDESWGVDPAAIADGIEPALLERHSPQLHLTSTAHVRASSMMRRRLMVALRNLDPDVLLLFWGAPPESDWSDEAVWRMSSPHWSKQRLELMRRKYRAALAGVADPEIDDPDPVRGWAAQYLNNWPLLDAENTGIMPNWFGLSAPVPEAKPTGLAVAADLDATWLSLGAVLGSERPHLTVPMSQDGKALRVKVFERRWFVSEVARIQRTYGCPVAIDKKGPAAFLIPDLASEGVVLTEYGLDDFIQACADLVDAVASSSVEHDDDPDLNGAVAAAGWRTVGDRRVFGRKSGDISALEAVALALAVSSKAYDPMASFLT